MMPEIEIRRNDNSQFMDKIMSIDPDKRKKLKINRTTLCYGISKRILKKERPLKFIIRLW